MDYFHKVKNNPKYPAIIAKHTYCKTYLWQSLKLFSTFITFLKREIIHYFVIIFKVSGRSIEEILISILPYIFYSLVDS